MAKTFFMLGAALAGLAVLAGAFGAHALKAHLSPELLQTFETAARYQMYHALALLAVAWASTKNAGSLTKFAGWLFVIGIILFSGSLYAYTLSFTNGEGIKAFAMITPLGGLCFMVGWLLLALSTRKWSPE